MMKTLLPEEESELLSVHPFVSDIRTFYFRNKKNYVVGEYGGRKARRKKE